MVKTFTNSIKRLSIFCLLVVFTSSMIQAQTFTIGTDDGANNNMSYPTPFGDWYKTQRTQFLYLASDLSDAGMGAGDITAISWNVVALDPTVVSPDGATEGYTVKMLATGTTSLGLSTWEEGATTVWGPMDYTPVVGTNTFTLTTPFNWDGSSNIIIEICGGSDLGVYTYNGETTWSGPFAYNASHTYRSDVELDPCGYTGATYFDYTPGGYDYRPQVTFDVTPGTDCEGTPVAGAASSTAESVCAGETFTVSISPTTGGGISYQWASSTDGFSFSDITGATAPSYSTTQSVATWYRATVTCSFSGGSSTSDPVYVLQNDVLDCYCVPTYTTGTSDGDFISNVSLGTISNATEGADAPYYTFYDDMSTDVAIDGIYTITVTTGSYTSFNGVAAWIDYNQDGSFDELTEKLGEVLELADYSPGDITFTVPSDALEGETRLRTREVYNTIGMTACDTYTYGETEDYMVNVTATNCGIPAGLFVDDITATTATLNWSSAVGAEGYTVAIWDIAASFVGKIHLTGADITSLALTTYLEPSSSYAFRVKSLCGALETKSPYPDWYYFTTGSKLGQFDNNVNVYPNPSNGTFNVALSGYANDEVEISIINTVGEIVEHRNVIVGSTEYTVEFDLSDLPSGMYQVVIAGEKATIKTLLIDK